MKPSHFTTPRTMEDATFQPWGQAIHGSDKRPFDKQDVQVMWACAIAAVATVVIVLLKGGAV